MAVKRNGLGKGLDSLIPTKAENNIKKEKSVSAEEKKAENYGEINVKINLVEPNREQPRKDFDEDALL